MDKNDSLGLISLDNEEMLYKADENIENEFYDFVQKLIKGNPLENLLKMDDVDEMILFTKNNLINFLNYQQEMNNLIKNQINKNDEYYEYLKKYSQKYANNLKKLKILEKKQKIYDIKKCLYNNNNKISIINKIIQLKNNEIDLFKEINNNHDHSECNYDYDIEDNLNINEINNLNDSNNKTNNSYNILINLLKNCIQNLEKMKKL